MEMHAATVVLCYRSRPHVYIDTCTQLHMRPVSPLENERPACGVASRNRGAGEDSLFWRQGERIRLDGRRVRPLDSRGG